MAVIEELIRQEDNGTISFGNHLMDEKKKGGITVETEHIFPIIKRWLYSDKEIFLRELISNASDAMDKLYFKSMTENIGIWGNRASAEKFALITGPKLCDMHIVEAYETFQMGKYTVTALPATHGTESPLIYILSDGKGDGVGPITVFGGCCNGCRSCT